MLITLTKLHKHTSCGKFDTLHNKHKTEEHMQINGNHLTSAIPLLLQEPINIGQIPPAYTMQAGTPIDRRSSWKTCAPIGVPHAMERCRLSLVNGWPPRSTLAWWVVHPHRHWGGYWGHRSLPWFVATRVPWTEGALQHDIYQILTRDQPRIRCSKSCWTTSSTWPCQQQKKWR